MKSLFDYPRKYSAHTIFIHKCTWTCVNVKAQIFCLRKEQLSLLLNDGPD